MGFIKYYKGGDIYDKKRKFSIYYNYPPIYISICNTISKNDEIRPFFCEIIRLVFPFLLCYGLLVTLETVKYKGVYHVSKEMGRMD